MHPSQLCNPPTLRHRRLHWIYLVLLISALVSFGGIWPTRAASLAALVKDINTTTTRINPPSLASPAFMTTSGSSRMTA